MHLLKLRTLVPASTKTSSSFSAGRRSLRYLVQQSPIAECSRTAPASDFSQQLFEKAWTLSGSRPLEKLKLHLPGITFISVDPDASGMDDLVAKIRVMGDSIQAVEGVSVKSKLPYRTILDFSSASRNPGGLFTQVLLPRGHGSLRNLATRGQGLVIVEDGVLAMHSRPDETIKLAATQGSCLAISSAENVDISKLQIAVANRSKVYMQAPGFKARDQVTIAGTGGSQVHLQSHSNLCTPLLKVAIAGSGKFRAQADTFALEAAKSAIFGSGSVVLASGAQDTSSPSATRVICATHKIAIFGAGDVDCADVPTERVVVAVAGHGNVALDSIESAKVAAFGVAKVAYVRAPPASLKVKSRVHGGADPVGRMSADDQARREQQSDLEKQELQDFWRDLPTRATVLDTASE